MDSFRFILTLSIFLRIFSLSAAVDWPRIRVKDGHLLFTVEKDKNISLITSGTGGIYVNGQDLAQIAKLTPNSSFIPNLPYIPGSPENLNSNIYDKVALLESGLQNLTLITVKRPAIQRVNRRLNALTTRIRRLNILLNANECNSNPCQNGGTCQDLFDNFMCFCPPEWEGTTCETDVNECTNFAGTDLGCQNGATCINKPGSYACVCSNGWNGVHCTRKGTDCATAGSDLCGHGVCVPQGTSLGYKCICEQGWQTNGKDPACNIDVNECDTFPCSKTPLVQCINVPGSFFCGHCPLGYTGNGYHCNDLNECYSNNGGCSLNPKVLCINTPGSRICGSCPPSYIGDGVTCTYSGGTCGVNNGGCHPLANCKHTPGVISTFVECTCPPGYAGNGVGPNGCIFTTQEGCRSNPCIHGTCASSNGTDYICTCTPGYSGKNCNVPTFSPCASNPCLNGGSCVNTEKGYFCKCTSDFTGFNCNLKESNCGGILNSYAGTLDYNPSNIGGGYKYSCAWVIETNSTKILNITFKKFNIKESPNCASSWVQIHDGRNTASQSLGRFCGNTPPKNGTFLSTHNNLYIWFRGDSLLPGNGFTLSWMSVEPACHEEIVAKSHGVLKSPGFPGNYPNNRDCVWSLTAPIDKRIEFHFFALSLGEDDSNCTKDYVSFHSSRNGKAFAIYCNNSHPPPLTAPFHQVYVRFHSDESGQNLGFQIGYTVIAGIPNCGGVYTKVSGRIKGEIVPTLEPITYQCEYKIKVPDDMRIRISFLTFDVVKTVSGCSEELIIYEGTTSESPIIGRYCGSELPPPYVSLGNELLILFKTRLSKGFSLKYEAMCGGTFTSSQGVIASSEYPESRTTAEDCIYQINRPIGDVISLNIIETMSNVKSGMYREPFRYLGCQNIEVRDGDNENAPLLGNYCEKTPIEVISSHNVLWIKVKKSLYAAKRFYMNYTTSEIGCGGILKEKSGTIQSPSHPSKYPSSLKCTWLIVAPPNMVIQLSWSNFHLENSYDCKYDRVEIYDNNTNTGMGGLIGRYCGSKLPPILITSSNIMTVTFKTDVSINQDGFVASYTFLPANSICGGTYFTPSGVLTSPFYPESYPVNTDCKWVIHVPSGSQIMLKINDFQMEPIVNCRYDFLEIRNGGTAASPLIGKFCGNTIPKLIPSHANQLFLRFKSDFTRTAKGFNITWSATSTGCGGTLTSPRGSIISPHYPEPYDKNTVCVWKISVNPGSVIQLVFADIDLENRVACRSDYVELFDGITATSKSLGRYCNTAHPPTIKSTGNHVMVKFRSDISEQGRGFQLQYSTICNNELRGYSGVIESPNYPLGYPMDQDCKWEIGVSQGNQINITFSHFDLERSSVATKGTCEFDYVEISSYDVENEKMKVLSRLCGSPEYIEPMTINSNSTTIHFVSDHFLSRNGFRLEWHIFGCGGVLDRPEGTISTPGYPNAYPINTRCEWVISLPSPGKSVQITFDKNFHLETSHTCYNDYIEIYNGRKAVEENLLRRFCDSTNVTNITSNGHEMFVVFQSDYSLVGKGFTAEYRTVDSSCGGNLFADDGFIMSPNYPKNYERRSTCEWLISINQNHVIDLFFHDVDLTENCNKTNIRVYDGPGEGYPLLTTVCGTNKPNDTIKTSYNHAYVKFHSDSILTAKGFRLEFKTACGGILNSETSGLIQFSPSYADFMEGCEYTIIAPNPADHVSLTITNLYDNVCYFDFVNVYDGYNGTDPLIGSYCDEIPPMITSTGAALFIMAGIGFKASYSTFSSACGGTLEHEFGKFATPNYPNEYPDDIECEWTIKLSPSFSHTINFEDFELVQSEFCNEDFVEIRAIDDNNKLLGDYCGTTIPPTITANGSIWIYFKSVKSDVGDTGQKKKGFMARYSLNHENEFSGDHGFIYSPLYPEYYAKSTSFYWRIRVAFGHKIRLIAKEFSMGTDDEMCYYEAHVVVYDGYNSDSDGEFYCAGKRPNFESSSNVIYIEAAFEPRLKQSRFLLEWTQIDVVPKPNYINPITYLSSNESCGDTTPVVINGSDPFLLTSPGYPWGYKKNLNCTWMFSTSPQNHLGIRFNDLRVINAQSCIFDKILVYAGDDSEETAWRLIKTACLTNETRNEILGSNLMRVVFRSNSFSNSSGFQATISERCGGSIKASNGVIKITQKSSIPDDECQWNITVRSGRTIVVAFKTFDLGESPDSPCNDYLILRNGQYADSPFLGDGKYCGKDTPPTLKSTSNHLYIKLHSTQIAKNPGFELTFKEKSFDCGGRLTLTHTDNSTTINSPNYPNIPQPHIECVWTIRAPPGESIRIDFLERFDLTNSVNCDDEYVELRDGAAVTSKLIGRFCDETPSTQSTTDNVLYIKFFTQVDDPRNGFKAKIQIKTCGGIIRATSGVVSSPNYGLKEFYPEYLNCSWEIIGPRDHFLNISFKEIDIPPQIGDCRDSRVKIIDHLLKNNSKVIMDECKMKPELKNIQTFGNHVTIRFISGKVFGLKHFAGFYLNFVTDQEVCGGKLTSPSGYITSPGYPSMNHHQRICEWNIEVPRGRRIKVKVIDLDLDRNSHTYEQGIVFFNDHDFYSEIEYLNAGDKADYIYSSDNTMAIYFWSSHVSSHRGFKLQYTSDEPTLCVGDFGKEYGVIYTPKNVTLFRCSWSRNDDVKVQRTVTLKITSNLADRKPVRNCGTVGTNLDVKTKVNGEMMLVAEYCNFLKKPKTLRIPYPSILLTNMQRAGYLESINYTVEYSTQNCGGIITKPIGTIESPEFPSTPSRTYDCVWVIDLLENQAVKINFTSMDLDKDCEKSSVKVHNGPIKTSPLIGTFCGTSLPASYVSQSKGIWIEYHFEMGSNGKGFKLEYEPVIGGCGGVFYDTNRFLQTPDYPNDYPNNVECVWELHTGDGNHVGLIFDKRFHLESSNNCENDYVKIYDYKNEDWALIKVLCGKDPPSFVNSTSTKMKVVFRSNSKISQAGFRASWTSNCGGDFIADKFAKTISSPGYPNNYKANMFCVYNITSNRGNLKVEFLDFSLEHGDDNCIFDNVTLTYKVYRSVIKNTYCSTTPPPFIVVENNLIVTFRSDSFLNRRGFLLSYKSDDCGGEITEPTEIKGDSSVKWDKTTQSMRYYGQQKPCVWNITAPQKSQSVIVRLESLNLRYTFNCSANYLMFFEGLTQNYENRLAKFCGNYSSIIHPENTPIISSTSNQMTIVYRDLSMISTDFKALIYFSYGPSAGCGGRSYLNDTKTFTIYGPTSLYELDCLYQIETMDGYYISLKFINLDSCKLNTNGSFVKNCSCSFFEIRDGGGPLSEIIASFCDQELQPTYKTTGAKLWIRWKTNIFNMGTGFKLEVTPILSACGPSRLVAEKIPEVLVSPNFPQMYPGATKCSWNIVLPQNVSCCMHLKFIEFDLGDVPDDATTCPGDKVEISERHSSESDESSLGSSTIFATKLNNQFMNRMFYSPSGVHQYCGKIGHEYDYYAFSREAKIDFESFSGSHGKGFKLEYKIDRCYRNLTGQQGKVKTKVEGTGCTILITAPMGTTVSIYFYNYYIPSRMTCEEDKMEIYDGPTTNSKKLVTHCSRNPNPVFSTQNVVLIQITKRENMMSHMLDFTYTSTDKGQGCGGKIYNYHGVITSPLYPQNYPNISDCLWEINVPHGLDLEIHFTQFSIPNRCDTDYVTITTYSDKTPNEHKYCGDDLPPKLRSSKKVLVRYVTSFHNGAVGWVATFGAIVNQRS